MKWFINSDPPVLWILRLVLPLLLLAGCVSRIPLRTCENPTYSPTYAGDIKYEYRVTSEETPCLQRIHYYGRTARVVIYQERDGELKYLVLDKDWE